MDNLTNYYYNYHYGFYDYETQKEYNITNRTIGHLLDNGISRGEISGIIRESNPGSSLTIDDLPSSLWAESLLDRYTFYYHNELHITSDAPVYDRKTNTMKSSKFFLEMKILYTLNNLYNYYQIKTRAFEELSDTKRDLAALKHLLNTYKKVSFIEPIDFVLSLIDAASNDTRLLNGVFDLQRYESETYEHLKQKVTVARAYKHNRIIWRG